MCEKVDYEKIDTLIASGTNEALEELGQYLNTPDIKKLCGKDTRLSYVYLWNKVYTMENASNVDNHIFSNRSSIEELEEIWNNMKFLLWHAEFETEDDAVYMLEQYIDYENISNYALYTLIKTVAIDVDKMMKLILGVA